MDRNAGYMLNGNLENYKILGAKETPEIKVELVENYIAQGIDRCCGDWGVGRNHYAGCGDWQCVLQRYHAIMNNGTCAMVHPSSTAVPLLEMNAQVELTSKRRKRMAPMSEFYVLPEKSVINETIVAPGELITNIFVPVPEPETRSAYQKYGEKESFDWPVADAGVVLVMDGTRCRKAAIVLGVAAPTPIRSAAAEAVLIGKTIDEATAREAGKAAMQNATSLSQNGYKVQLFQTAIYRTILLAAGQRQRDPSSVG